MKSSSNLLIEIGTEELPPHALKTLSECFATHVEKKLRAEQIAFTHIKSYATPRRLALIIHDLANIQPDRSIEKRGPAIKAALDATGNPTPALQGFLRACNTTLPQLEKVETEQGAWFVYRHTEKGKTIDALLPRIISEALMELPIPKPMRWGNRDIAFARPIHWITLLHGKKIIDAEVFGFKTDRITYGHRFLSPKPIKLKQADDYLKALQKTYVMADFEERKNKIRADVLAIMKRLDALPASSDVAAVPETLLNEVTSLVEWPAALLAQFDPDFLNIPQEALISAMQHHQKSFPLFNKQGQLLPQFITISNINSKNPKEVIRGNERVMRARLSDAKFFYDTDCKHPLDVNLDSLKNIVFQNKLGSVYDKTKRLVSLTGYMSETLKIDKKTTERAAWLCKTDLVSSMVSEFPELQGIMGSHYARHQHESASVIQAICEHYQPRFSGDRLPNTPAGCVLAIADRLDTLVGIFGINQAPTGDKDPFALRRAAVGLLRILIEKQLPLNLINLIAEAQKNYTVELPNKELAAQVLTFILERLRAWYQEKGITGDVLNAVLASPYHTPVLLDIHQRVLAVKNFQDLTESIALAAANKRVGNLLIKSNQLEKFNHTDPLDTIKTALFSQEIEHTLFKEMHDIKNKNGALLNDRNYADYLKSLSTLKNTVDNFLDNVLVMDENEAIQNNRLALLAALRHLFLQVADISALQS